MTRSRSFCAMVAVLVGSAVLAQPGAGSRGQEGGILHIAFSPGRRPGLRRPRALVHAAGLVAHRHDLCTALHVSGPGAACGVPAAARGGLRAGRSRTTSRRTRSRSAVASGSATESRCRRTRSPTRSTACFSSGPSRPARSTWWTSSARATCLPDDKDGRAESSRAATSSSSSSRARLPTSSRVRRFPTSARSRPDCRLRAREEARSPRPAPTTSRSTARTSASSSVATPTTTDGGRCTSPAST